jgi:uncharacterized Zn finger protein
MAKIRTMWYEYCQNCSNRAKVEQTGTEWTISCETCGNVLIVDELTPNRPE